MNCNHCQEQLLHYLYDVLDPEERAQIAVHLDECAACRSAREALAAQQELLALAAKESFAEVSFQPPAETPKRLAEPTQILPRRTRGFSWVRVAVAAAIIIFVFGGGSMGVIGWVRSRGDVQTAEARIEKARRASQEFQDGLNVQRTKSKEEIKAIEEQINRLFDDWSREANDKRREQQSRPKLQVEAPTTASAGAKIPVQVNLPAAKTEPRAANADAKGTLEAKTKIASKAMTTKENPAAPGIGAAARGGAGAGGRVEIQVNDKTNNRAVYKQEIKDLQEKNQAYLPNTLIQPGVDTKNLAMDVRYFDKEGKVRAEQQVTLGGMEYLTHLVTDRPMYRPGEPIRFRSLTVERFSLKPAQEDLHLVYRLLAPNGQELAKLEGAPKLLDKNGQPVNGPDGKPLRGVGSGEFVIAGDAPGGQYTLEVKEVDNHFPAERRSLLVNQWQMPRMNKELKFHRSSYGPGDLVEFVASAKRVEGGAPLANQQVRIRAEVDGEVIHVAQRATDNEGKILVRFPLREERLMPRGIGTVTVEFHDGAGPEPIVRPIPIVLNKVYVEFFPEGGELVQSVPNRVYFQVSNNLGKPAELKGKIVDQAGATVVTLETLHDDREEGINQGQGSFTFTPAAGKRYEFKIDTPIGVKPIFDFPQVRTEGVVLHLTKNLAGATIDAEVTSADRQRMLMVAAYCRGRLLDQRQVLASAGKPTPVSLKTDPQVSGVYRVTVYEIAKMGDDAQFLPRAERLTYRKTTNALEMALDNLKKEYTPGEHVNLRVRSKQKDPAVALVSVVDLSLIKLADDKTDRAMPTHFLLTTEIRRPEDLENADVLVGTHPKAETALDLLLGTQGWRRFAEQDPVNFQRKNPRDAEHVMPALARSTQRRDNVEDVVAEKVDKVYAVKAAQLLEKLAQKEEVENGPRDAAQQAQSLQASIQQAEMVRTEARVAFREYEHRMLQYGLGALMVGALLLGILAIVMGVRRLGQGRPALGSLVTGTSLLLFIFMGSLAVVFYMIGSNGEMPFALNHQAAREQEMAVQNAAVAKGMAPAPPMAAAPGGGGQGVPPQAADVGPPAPTAPLAEKKMEEPLPRMAPEMAKGAPAEGAAKDRLAVDAKRFELQQAAPANMVRNAPPPPPGPPGGGPMQQQANGFAAGFGGGNNNGAPGAANALVGGPGQQLGANVDQFNGGQFRNQAVERERGLRQKGDVQTIINERMRRNVVLPPVLPAFVVREYAHLHAQNPDNPAGGPQANGPQGNAVRRDFTETVCWMPAVILPTGEADVGFDLSDSVTRYQVTVYSHSLDGRLGANTFELAARLPFSIDPKVPFEISNTDKVVIPVAVKNDTDQPGRVELAAKATGLKTQDPQTRDVQVDAKDRNRGYFTYEAAQVSGDAHLRVKGTLNANQFGADTVERSFKIVPDGFPMKGAASGLLERAVIHEIELPAAWVSGTLRCQVQVFPSTLAQLQKGLEGLLREPCGCFEQSSSSNYPNVLILNYLQESGQGEPNVEKRARGLIDSGYQKLTSFECINPSENTRRGYEWFGQTAPPHEALTAYGLLQFRDMAKVYNVDPAMVERTRKYLLDQRDGQGGFKRNARAIDSFGRAPQHITDAYIVWALTDSGGDVDLSKELAALAKRAEGNPNPYFVALVALGHVNAGKTEEAVALAKKLKAAQKDDGRLEGTEMSITGSQGRDLNLETTALSVLAWLKLNRPEEFHTSIDKAVQWLSAQRSGQGSFGATQSTILALKALIAHTRDAKKIAEDGKLTATLPRVKDAPIAETSFTAGAAEPITLDLPEGRGLQPGKNKVVIEITGKNVFPYTLGWSYQTLTPPSNADCPVKLAAKLDKETAPEGDTVKLRATVENATDQGRGMTLAILGLPAGLTIPEDAKQLKEMAKLRDEGTKPGVISHWELRGRELVLYWRDLAPKAKIDVEIDLICRLPGTYRGPASRAYLYYNADHKNWIEPLAITIEPQRAE